jgi:hypothetical protein
MAKQRGPIKLEGTIGDITFLKTSDGYLAKGKTIISAARIASDPAFQRTRENNAEFGRAGKAAKLLRAAFKTQMKTAADRRMGSRLTKEMVRVIQADVTNGRGLRNVIDGEAELLQGFNCNEGAALGATLSAPYTAGINRATGAVTLTLPSFVPSVMITPPGGATHFRIGAAAAAINFEEERYDLDATESARLPLNNQPTAALTLSAALPAGSTHPIFLVVGIEFTQEVNGTHYTLKSGAFNALAIVLVSGQ